MLLEMKLHACVWVFAGWVDGQVRLPQGGIVWVLGQYVRVAEGRDLDDSNKGGYQVRNQFYFLTLDLHLTHH